MKEESERHRHWNKINLKAKVFDNVRPLTGNRKILYDIGYTQNITNEKDVLHGIAFPDKEKPYQPKVRELAIDLCIAKYELLLIEKRTHPKLTELRNIEELPSSFFVDNDSIGQSIEPNDLTTVPYLLSNSPKLVNNQTMYMETIKRAPTVVQREKRIQSYERSSSDEEATSIRKGIYY